MPHVLNFNNVRAAEVKKMCIFAGNFAFRDCCIRAQPCNEKALECFFLSIRMRVWLPRI